MDNLKPYLCEVRSTTLPDFASLREGSGERSFSPRRSGAKTPTGENARDEYSRLVNTKSPRPGCPANCPVGRKSASESSDYRLGSGAYVTEITVGGLSLLTPRSRLLECCEYREYSLPHTCFQVGLV